MSIPQNSSKTLMVSGGFFVKLAGRMIRHHTVNFDDNGQTCLRTLNILLVDDDRNLVTTLSYGLRKAMGEEVSVAVCFSGSEALSLLGNQAFDVVISDYNMPGTSGLELLKRIRQEDGETTLILTTAYGTDALEEGVRQLGGGYMTKPFEPSFLVQTIKDLVQSKEAKGSMESVSHRMGKPGKPAGSSPGVEPARRAAS